MCHDTSTLLLLILLMVSAAAPAQQHRQPTPAEERAARDRFRTPTDQQLNQAVQSTPKLDVAPQSVDIEALARDYENMRKKSQAAPQGPALYVFVTLAMPEASLKALIPQAEKASAILVVRGLVDRSIKKTAERVTALIGKHQVAWLIDPEAFGRYQISVAPTVILDPNPKGASCAAGGSCQANIFAKVAGDVRLAYALKKIRSDAPKLASAADAYLVRLGE